MNPASYRNLLLWGCYFLTSMTYDASIEVQWPKLDFHNSNTMN